MAFVSYRRKDSRAAALQLYERLDERSFAVFLDRHKVATGADVPSVLMDRLADSDVVVLLDTPDALDSTWVADEINRAVHLAVGVVQVLWPNHDRAGVSELSVPVYLDRGDVDVPAGAPLDGESTLADTALAMIVTQIERVRARQLAARRAKLVEELCRAAGDCSIEVVHQPGRYLEMHVPRGHLRVVPVTGHVRAENYHEVHDDRGGCDEVVLLHDRFGLLPRRWVHIEWLDGHLPV